MSCDISPLSHESRHPLAHHCETPRPVSFSGRYNPRKRRQLQARLSAGGRERYAQVVDPLLLAGISFAGIVTRAHFECLIVSAREWNGVRQ